MTDNFCKKLSIKISVSTGQIEDLELLLFSLIDLANNSINSLYLKIEEGSDLLCLRLFNSDIISFLHNFCEKYNIKKSQITIEHSNLVQDKNIWPNYIHYFFSKPMLYGQNVNFKLNKQITKKFGLFVGGSRWHRLWLGSYLYNQCKQDILISYHQNHFNKTQPANLYIDDLLLKLHDKKDVGCLERISYFCKKLPLHLDDSVEKNNKGYINYDRAYDIIKYYNNIFVDIVCETWHEGNAFMPTEKIGRCFISKTPFIVYGGKNYLFNLKKLGFLTFGNIFDESYDNHEGIERIFAIKQIIDFLAAKNYKELISINQKIDNILEHNLHVYLGLTQEKIKKAFQ